MRLFLALALPDALRSALAALRSDIPGARWVPAPNLHATLHFLGEVQAETAEALASEVHGLAFAPVPLAPAGLAAFPSPRRPRVLVVKLASNPSFEALHAATAAAIARRGFVPEARPFRPHVTVARLKNPDAASVQTFLHAPPALPAAVARQVALYVSTPAPGGSHYAPLAVATAT